jgi:hypothetical protein
LQISNCRGKERFSNDLLSTISTEKDAVDISIIIVKEGAIPDVDIKRALIPKFHMLFTYAYLFGVLYGLPDFKKLSNQYELENHLYN